MNPRFTPGQFATLREAGDRFWRRLPRSDSPDLVLLAVRAPSAGARLRADQPGGARTAAPMSSTGRAARRRPRAEAQGRRIVRRGSRSRRHRLRAVRRPAARLGPQQRQLAGAGVWVLPNPSGLNAHFQIADLARAFAALREEEGVTRRGTNDPWRLPVRWVRFELDRAVGPFELSHASCRKTTRSAFIATLGVRREDSAGSRGGS